MSLNVEENADILYYIDQKFADFDYSLECCDIGIKWLWIDGYIGWL